MSTANTAARTDPLPAPDVAYANLFEGLAHRAFFHKLAAINPNYYPRTEKQAMALLNIADSVDSYESEEAVKQAEDGLDPFVAASNALNATLKQAGYRHGDQEAAMSRKQAAAELSQDATLYNSILSLAAHRVDQARTEQAKTNAV